MRYGEITCTFNGNGSSLAPGLQAVVRAPYAGTIVEVTLLAGEVGSCVVDIWKSALGACLVNGDSICASDLPELTGAASETDTALTGWATSFSIGDVFLFNLVSSSAVKTLTACLRVRKS